MGTISHWLSNDGDVCKMWKEEDTLFTLRYVCECVCVCIREGEESPGLCIIVSCLWPCEFCDLQPLPTPSGLSLASVEGRVNLWQREELFIILVGAETNNNISLAKIHPLRTRRGGQNKELWWAKIINCLNSIIIHSYSLKTQFRGCFIRWVLVCSLNYYIASPNT